MSSVTVLEKASRVEIKDRIMVMVYAELLADAQRYRCHISHRIRNFRSRIDFTESNHGSNDHPIDESMDSVHGVVCSPQTPYRNTGAFSLPPPVPGENEWKWVRDNGKQTFLLMLSAQEPRNRRKLYWPVISL